MLHEYGIKLTFTPPYHSQANPVERTNLTLKTLIAMYVEANHRTWDVHLYEFRRDINTAVQSLLKVSPAFLNYGRNPKQFEEKNRSKRISRKNGSRSMERQNEETESIVRRDIATHRKR